jgi:hypothetical protein
MKKDIPELKVEDLAIVIAPRAEGAEHEDLWEAYLFNLKEEAIQNVMVSSWGYGELNGREKKTTTLRHFFERVDPLSLVPIEPILKEAFALTNEYWVSFSFEGQMYDKRYVFVVGSMEPSNFMLIPFLNRKGVMIR